MQVLVVTYLNPSTATHIIHPKKYYFKSEIPTVTVNDIVVVPSSSRKYALCEVVEVLEDCFENAEYVNAAKQFIIDVVDLEAHNKRIEDANRLQYIKDKLDAKRREFDKTRMYELLAEHDPEAKALLQEMTTLTLSATVVEK